MNVKNQKIKNTFVFIRIKQEKKIKKEKLFDIIRIIYSSYINTYIYA